MNKIIKLSKTDIENEEWVDIIGYDGYYEISSMGRVLSKRSGKLRKVVYRKGFASIRFTLEGITNEYNFAKLMALHFIDDYNEEPIHFKNHNRYDCRRTNLKIINETNVIELYSNKKIHPSNEVSEMLHNIGYKKCSICKNIKTLKEFSKANRSRDKNNNCSDCNTKLHYNFVKSNREEITDWYIKNYGSLKGIKVFNKRILNNLKNEIILKRTKFTLDGVSFKSKIDFAKYIEKNYRVSVSAVLKRLDNGYTEKECTLSRKILGRDIIKYRKNNKGI